MLPTANRTIEEILTAAGVEVRRGNHKMVCPKCDEQKLTISRSKGIATCFGCQAFWTEYGDCNRVELDWATYIVAEIAKHCQDELPSLLGTLDWLAKRGLPIANPSRIDVKDAGWLAENDLGGLPVTSPSPRSSTMQSSSSTSGRSASSPRRRSWRRARTRPRPRSLPSARRSRPSASTSRTR